MKEQAWTRQEYESWDEAFRGLAPIIRQQSVRVADYTRALFVVASKKGFGKDIKGGADRMRGAYADLAFKCGVYHQLGKALVPHEYQIWQNDFTDEEKEVYKKYTTDGRLLIASLQIKSERVREKRRGTMGEIPTDNVPFLMIRESCEQHMERYDGSGYPNGLKDKAISPIAQIVGLAKELDRLASETKSETPFEFAINSLREGKGTKWSEQLISVLDAAEAECYNIYNKYISYTRTLPKTISLVDKKPGRKMGLHYRPMVSDSDGTVKMYEAIPWFGGILEQPDETETLDDLRDLFKRTSLVEPISWYLLYEATDTLLRMKNCKIETEGILLHMMPEFYSLDTQLQKFNQLFIDQPVDKEKLFLTISVDTVKNANKTTLKLINRYARNGIRLVLDGYRPGDIDLDLLRELEITCIRPHPDTYLNGDMAGFIHSMKATGFTFFGKDADDADVLAWLVACEFNCSSGTMTGSLVDEDGLIFDSLARESNVG